MTNRPDDGYRVAARIEGRSSRRGRFLAAILGVAVLGWAGATALDRLGGHAPQGSALASGVTGRGSGVPSLFPGQTVPPAVEVRQPSAPLGRLPVVLNDLAWLDLARGTAETGGQQFMQWRFALADGAACLCVEPAVDANPAVLHLFRFDRNGAITSARSERWTDADPTFGLADAILDPGGGEAIVASVVQAKAGWKLHLQRIPFDGTQAVSGAESPIEIADLGDSAQVVMRLTAAPDGSVFRVDLTRLADDPSTEWHGAWIVRSTQRRFARAVAAPAARSDVPFTECAGQAWATPTVFVELCHTPRDDGRFDAFARLQDLEGRAWDIDLGPVQLDDPAGWLVDGAHGVIYAWTSFAHGFFRIDAATRALSVRLLAGVDSNGAPTVPIVTPEPLPSGVATPSLDPSPAMWQPTTRATETTESPLVGSPDGRLLYAAGLSVGQNGAAPSTGIWVFDSRSLAVVDHWPATVSFRALGLEPRGEYIIGTGEPGADEVAAFGNHGEELAVLDRRDGSVVVILRSLALRLGGVPFLLPAPLRPVQPGRLGG